MNRRAALLVGSCWVAVLAGVNAHLLLRTDTLQHYVDQLLLESFATEAEYDSFEGGFFEPLILRRFRVPRPDDPDVLLAKVRELQIEVDWWSFLAGRPRIREVVIRKPHLVLAWDTGGKLTLPSPFASRGDEGGDIPRLRVEGLELRLLNSPYLTGPDELIPVESLDLRLRPALSSRWAYAFSAEIEDDELGKMRASGSLAGSDYSITLERPDVTLTPKLRAILRPDLAAFFDDLRVEVKQPDGSCELRSDFFRDSESGAAAFRVSARFDDVAIAYRDWPLKIEGLQGVIDYQDGRFRGRDLTAHVESGRLRFDVDVDLTAGATPDVRVGGELLGLQLSDALVESIGALPEPGPDVREQLQQFAVRGPVNIDLALIQARGGGFRPSLTVHLAGCDFVYRGPRDELGHRDEGFPYAIEDLRGAVDVDDSGLRFDRLTARRGSLSVRGRGFVEFGGDESGHDVRLSLAGLRLEETLWSAMGKDLRATVEDLDPRGYADVRIVIARARGAPSGALELEADLQGIQLQVKSFPYALDDLRGVLRVREDRVSIESVTARHGEGRIQFEGSLGIGTQAGDLHVDLRAQGVALDEDLMDAVAVPAPEAAETLRALHPEGAVDLAIGLRRQAADDPILADGTVTLRGISLAPEEPAIRVGNLDGVLELSGRDLRILEGMTGEISGERFNLGGQFRTGGNYEFHLEAQDFSLDDALVANLAPLSPRLRDPATRPRISGRASAQVTVTKGSSGPVYGALVDLVDVCLKPVGWPEGVQLEKLNGKLWLREGSMNLQKVSARISRPRDLAPRPLPGPLTSDRPFATERDIDLWVDSITVAEGEGGITLSFGEVRLTDVPLESWFLELLGLDPQRQEGLSLPNAVGTVSLSVSSARVRSGDVMLSGGELRIKGLHLGRKSDLFLEAAKITDFNCVFTSENSELAGNLSGINLTVMGVPVPQFEGRFTGDRDGFTITDISGILFGHEPSDPSKPLGRITGEATSLGVNWRTGQFAMTAHVDGVKLGAALAAMGHPPKRIGGVLKMALALGGVFGDPGSYIGSGRVQAETRHVIELPVFLNIIKAIDFSSWLTSPPRTEITIDFTVGNRQVNLTDAHLKAPDLDLRGTARITFGGIIYAQLEAYHRGGIPIVSDLLALVPSLLLSGIEVEGPLENPRVTARSLGTGGADGKLPHGRRPVVKPLKNP